MITNPQAIRFTERARAIANALGSLTRTLPQFALDVVSDFEVITSGAPGNDVISDGSSSIRPITKDNIAQLKYVAEQVLAALKQDDREAIVSRIATHTQPMF